MAKKIGLSVYGLSIVEGDVRKELHSVFDNKGMLDIIQEFANTNMKKLSNDPGKESVFYFDEIFKEDVLAEDGKKAFSVLYGRVKTGEYGIESELVNITDGSIYERSMSEADLLPFGFCVAVPEGNVTKSVIILQTLGNYGMKMALQRKFQECFEKISLNALWGEVLPKAYIDKFFNRGVLQKIRMIRYEIPEDISNRIGINYGVEQTREERIICKPIGFMERKRKEIFEWMAGQRSCTSIIEIEDFQYDDLKLEFKLGRTNKVISLRDTSKLRVNEDITDSVDMSGGNPEFNSLKQVMKETARDYLVGMGLLVEYGDYLQNT